LVEWPTWAHFWFCVLLLASLFLWELLWVPTSAYVGFGQLNIITCFQYLASIGSSLPQHLASIWKQVPVSSCKSNPFDHSQPHSARTNVHLFALLLTTGRAALNLNTPPQLSIKSSAIKLIPRPMRGSASFNTV
jgi:hypothetical protein